MRASFILALQLCLLSAGVRTDAPPPSQKIVLDRLGPGKYRAIVVGIWCNACTRAIVEEVRAIPGVREASFDYEDGFLWLSVDSGRLVKAGKIRHALRLAARRVNLGLHFKLSELQPAL